MEIITAQQALEEAKGMTFEKMWAMMMEDRKRAEEERRKSREEFDKRMEKSREEFDKRMEKSREEFDKRMEELSKNIGGLNNTLGELTEAMFSAQLCEKFEELGLPVHTQCCNKQFKEGKKLLAEIDVFIENGSYAIPVEIKTKLTTEDIDKHLERIGIVRGCLDARGDKRKLVGAVAGVSVTERVLGYAHEKGLFVIVPSGESATIADLPEGFKPREWV